MVMELRLMFKRALFCAALWCFMSSAYAEIWGFIDDKGVGHFASNKVDDRYELFSKEVTPEPAPEPVQNSSEPVAEAPKPPAQPAAQLSPKLAAFFESSLVLKNIRPIMQSAAQLHNLDVELLQALIAAESGFNITAISPKGALGLMQLIPETAARYGVQGDRRTTQQQKLFDPSINIHAGSRYLRDLLTMFKGQLDLALAAYNAGEGAVQKAGNKIPNYPETQNYVRTVTQMYAALKPPPPPPPQVTPVLVPQPKVPAGPDPLRPTKGRANGLPLK
jgi:hypothetical protein